MYKINVVYEKISDSKKIDNCTILYSEHLKKLYSPIQESLFVIALDSGHKIIFVNEMFKGGMNEALIDPKILFFYLIKMCTFSFIIAHNHPSGELVPSTEDKRLTERIEECGKILGLHLLDHIIFNDENCYSFLEQGLLDRPYKSPVYYVK